MAADSRKTTTTRRQAQGIAKAKAEGKMKGRPRMPSAMRLSWNTPGIKGRVRRSSRPPIRWLRFSWKIGEAACCLLRDGAAVPQGARGRSQRVFGVDTHGVLWLIPRAQPPTHRSETLLELANVWLLPASSLRCSARRNKWFGSQNGHGNRRRWSMLQPWTSGRERSDAVAVERKRGHYFHRSRRCGTNTGRSSFRGGSTRWALTGTI